MTAVLNPGSGVIKAKHFFVVQDCGQVINPDGTKNQIEGNVVQTVSRTLALPISSEIRRSSQETRRQYLRATVRQLGTRRHGLSPIDR